MVEMSALSSPSDRRRGSEVSDTLAQALQNAGPMHRERRRYLKAALQELNRLLTDAPGLLGPKVRRGLSLHDAPQLTSARMYCGYLCKRALKLYTVLLQGLKYTV